jgi:hypothetical protein
MLRVITQREAELQVELVAAIQGALPLTGQADAAVRSAEGSYRVIAVVLVALRHQFHASDGTTVDLRGRSRGYREIVGHAYSQAGAHGHGPIEKRLTAGVAYWVRKLLVERYGEEKLKDLGVLPAGSFASVSPGGFRPPHDVEDPTGCLITVVDLLNQLATDPTFMPSEDVLRSAARAIMLLQRKLAMGVQRVAA